ncbi:MAG: hypothetical protein ACFCGT_28380 [Sandaracinaceae bacterium]
MSEAEESGQGTLAPVDKTWTGPRFLVLLVITLIVSAAILFLISGIRSGDFEWDLLAHDVVRHSLP